MTQFKRYSINQSPLYRLNSKGKLANLLGISLRDLLFLASLEHGNYQEWSVAQKRRDIIAGFPPPTKVRQVQQPMPLLRDIHDKLALLLAKIEKPSFVYSATKGRSYLDNAEQHLATAGFSAFKVDIKNFYPEVRRKWVKRFFEKDMECAADVAHFLSGLCCTKGALPTGSPISPVLSYFACAPIFGWMERFAQEHGLKFTLYVDDMFFSGLGASRALSNRVLLELARNGLKGHKVAHFRPGQIRVITGVAVSATGVSIPFKRQKRIRLYEEAFAKTTDPEEVRILGRTLLGQYREGERIQPGSRGRAKPIQARMDAINAAVFTDLGTARPRRKRPKMTRRMTEENIAKVRARVTKPALAVSVMQEV